MLRKVESGQLNTFSSIDTLTVKTRLQRWKFEKLDLHGQSQLIFSENALQNVTAYEIKYQVYSKYSKNHSKGALLLTETVLQCISDIKFDSPYNSMLKAKLLYLQSNSVILSATISSRKEIASSRDEIPGEHEFQTLTATWRIFP